MPRPALHAAVASGGAAEVARLLAEGAVLDAADGMDAAALHLAADSRGNAHIVSQLLAAGASPLIADVEGMLPLHVAAAFGEPAAVHLLLQAAPQAALAADLFGMLPSHMAVLRKQGAEGVATLELLAAAAPATLAERACNVLGNTPLHVAAARGNHDAISLLLRHAPEAALVRSHDLPWKAGQLSLEMALACALGIPVPDYPPAAAAPEAYLETARLLLEAMPPEVALPILTAAGQQQQQLDQRQLVLPLYAALAARWPLGEAQWQQVPAACRGLGRTLPAVLQRSEAEAARLVAHLPAADQQRLQAFALALHRTQRQLGIDLPAGIASRILSQFDV